LRDLAIWHLPHRLEGRSRAFDLTQASVGLPKRQGGPLGGPKLAAPADHFQLPSQNRSGDRPEGRPR
jgi:hypothetical protein